MLKRSPLVSRVIPSKFVNLRMASRTGFLITDGPPTSVIIRKYFTQFNQLVLAEATKKGIVLARHGRFRMVFTWGRHKTYHIALWRLLQYYI